ncbi:hypothetical protein Kurepalu1_00022 [Pseudomonas phage vB_PpuP-Kurepalu-1]
MNKLKGLYWYVLQHDGVHYIHAYHVDSGKELRIAISKEQWEQVVDQTMLVRSAVVAMTGHFMRHLQHIEYGRRH